MDLISTISTLVSPNIVKPVTQFRFNKIIVPPIATLVGGYSSLIKGSYSLGIYSKTSKLLLNVYFSSYIRDKKLVYSQDAKSINYFEFEYSEFNGYEESFFTFEISRDGVAVKSIEIEPKYFTQQNFVIKSGRYQTLQNVAVYNGESVKYISESFEFSGFDGSPFEYGYINLRNYMFYTMFDGVRNSIPFKTFTLAILNSGQYFANVGLYSEIANITIIHLKAVVSDDWYHLEFKDPIYVNKLTGIMSNYPDSDSVETTSYFYLPRGASEYISILPISIGTSEFGFSKIQFSHSFYVNSQKQLFGYCSTSQYCVESYTSSNDDERGIIIKP